MKEIHPNIQVFTQYVNNHTKVKCKCLIDGYEWKTTPSKLINARHGCPKCGKSLPLTPEIFVEQMKEINPNITILEDYINSNTPIKVKCKTCEYEWKARPYHLKQGKGCKKCDFQKKSKMYSKGMEAFKDELKLIDNTIEVSGEYKNGKEKVNCKCKICGREWEAAPSNLLAGKGCPKCVASKGEKKISEWLKNNNIIFLQEYRFEDCCYDRPLIFDFYIPDLNIAIEYDGHQHFYPVKFGGISEEKAIENFNKNKERDSIKTKYCKDNNINLIRIPYFNYNNIDTILEKIFLNTDRAEPIQLNS